MFGEEGGFGGGDWGGVSGVGCSDKDFGDCDGVGAEVLDWVFGFGGVGGGYCCCCEDVLEG